MHKAGFLNKVADGLSRRQALLIEIQAAVLGFEIWRITMRMIEAGCSGGSTQPRQTCYLSKFQQGTISRMVSYSKGCICMSLPAPWEDKLIQQVYAQGHFGRDKTIVMLQQRYLWPSLQKEVSKFVERCQVCQMSKGTTTNAGLYLPFPVPTRPWECIGKNFIQGLPPNTRKLDFVFVVVDRFSNLM